MAETVRLFLHRCQPGTLRGASSPAHRLSSRARPGTHLSSTRTDAWVPAFAGMATECGARSCTNQRASSRRSVWPLEASHPLHERQDVAFAVLGPGVLEVAEFGEAVHGLQPGEVVVDEGDAF